MKKAGYFKNCVRCTEPFWAFPYNADKRQFCSTKCANKSNGIKQSETKRIKSFTHITEWRWSHAYNVWRNKCLVRDNFTCRNCQKDLRGKNMAIVHHPKSWEEHPELRYDVDNGMTLCRSCHNVIHVLPSRKHRSGF